MSEQNVLTLESTNLSHVPTGFDPKSGSEDWNAIMRSIEISDDDFSAVALEIIDKHCPINSDCLNVEGMKRTIVCAIKEWIEEKKRLDFTEHGYLDETYGDIGHIVTGYESSNLVREWIVMHLVEEVGKILLRFYEEHNVPMFKSDR